MNEGARLLKHKHAKGEDKPVTDTTLKCWHPESEFSWRDREVHAHPGPPNINFFCCC